jgi:hypothetical protein
MSRSAGGRRVRRGTALAVAAVLLAAAPACSARSAARPQTGAVAGSGTQRAEGAPPDDTFVPYDVRPLLKPAHKYLGAALDGVPQSLAPVTEYAAETGKRPNLLEYYAAWGDQFDARGVRNAWSSGALPLMAWEPFTPSLARIASGATDGYLRKFADDVRTLNIPLAISFGHEMNGHWYPWGTKQNTADDFVRAWRHVYDIFVEVGAVNVIWVWSPNVINPVPNTPLRPLYPGDEYVDWIGVVGYYTVKGAHTFPTLFRPTMTTIRQFTRRPFLLAETGAEQGPDKAANVADLFSGVAAAPDIVGFVWFEFAKRGDWRITADPSALAEFRRRAANPLFGFDPKHS